ncbi:MAG: M20/M25/M40 family metallo-hydrolase [Bacteroidetes bacterium]|nr:M20/M25/M40 family metallo-hydrolase [Bacteroidota bacterium]
MKKILTLILLLAAVSSAFSQDQAKNKAFNEITKHVIQGQMEFLASDWMEGRETGTKGAYMASDYIASMFKAFGLKPGGDPVRSSNRGRRPSNPSGNIAKRTYFQNFNLLEFRPGDTQKCSLIDIFEGGYNAVHLNYGIDFTLTPGVQAVTVQSPVVFVGYGFLGEGYNDYETVDVKGKIILRINGFPGHNNPDSKAYKKFSGDSPYARYMINRQKDEAAIQAGAAAIIDISAGSSVRGDPSNVPFRYTDQRTKYEGDEPFRTAPRVRLSFPDKSAQGITKINLSAKAMTQLLDNIGLDIEAFEVQSQKLKTNSKVLENKVVNIETSVVTRLIQARNVIGIIEGKNPESCIVAGAHYDHLGTVRDFIYNGSDDNASGTVGIMTIAKAMVESGIQPEQTLVFCSWTAEEKGLIGSAYYADHPLIEDIKCYMNYDMISRVAPDDPNKNKCDFQFTSTVPILKELTENHIRDYNVNLDMKYKGSEVPAGGSDFSSFSRKGIPIFLLHGKFTPDYHQFTDHVEKAEWTYMRDIIRVGFLNLYELVNYNW